MKANTYPQVHDTDPELIRELLNAQPSATLSDAEFAQWIRRRDYWLVELFPEVGPALEEYAIENDYEDIRRGN
jgi:hypothetical protein